MEEGCAKYPDGDVAVQIDPATFREFAVGEQFPFKVKLHAPRAFDESTIKRVIMRVAELNHNVSALYPLGLNQSKAPAFNIILTSGIAGESYDANSLVRPRNGLNTGFLSLPLTHPRFEEQIVELLVHIYTRARAHPNVGPRQRHEEKDLKIRFGTSAHRKLSNREIDALVAGWVSLAHTNNADMRLERLYQRLLDYAGYADDAPATQTYDALLREHQNPDFVKEWSGLSNAAAGDRYFFRQVFAPIQALRLARLLAEHANVDFESFLQEMHRNRDESFETLLRRHLSSDAILSWRHLPRFEKRRINIAHEGIQNTRYDFGVEEFAAARKLKLVSTPTLPSQEWIFSSGAMLEAYLYRQDQDRPAERVFLLTHSHEPKHLNAYVSPFQEMAGNTIRELLKFGDVMVLNRVAHGRTKGGISESYGNCEQPSFQWAFRRPDPHIVDAASWLRRRGYNKVTGVAFMVGAGIMLSAAQDEESGMDNMILFNPWRGRKWIDRQLSERQCGGQKIIDTLKTLSQQSKVPVTVFAQSNTTRYDGYRSDYEAIFSDFRWLEAAKWSDPWSVMFLRPSVWRPDLKRILN